jgi:hypothetical protein
LPERLIWLAISLGVNVDQFLKVEAFSISTAQAVMQARERFFDKLAGIT